MSWTFFDAPCVVLDTQVVFDWLVFRDPKCAALHAAIEAGRVRWLATPAMHDECFHVLGRGALEAWQPDFGVVRSAWARHCNIVDPGPPSDATRRLRCSDTSDQMFIDLAIGHRVRWLLSRDRAVLKLARRMRLCGVEVMTLVAWCADSAAIRTWGSQAREDLLE